MSVESASNGIKNPTFDDVCIITDDKSRRHPRWTRQETLTLIQAKEITENSPHKGRKINNGPALAGGSSSSAALSSSMSLSFDNTEPKWVMISSYCRQQGVKRGPAQCRKRWSNLIGDFRKVKAWEANLKDKADSFWGMRNDLRKERRLPVSFDVEVFKVLEGRETGAAGAISPLPLQAVAVAAAAAAAAAAAVSDEGNECGDEEEEDVAEEVEEEAEGMMNGDRGDHVSDVKDDHMSDVKDAGQEITVFESKEEIKKTTDNVTENPVKNFCTPQPTSGTEEQHHQAFSEHNKKSKHDASTESRQGINNKESQENGKRRRLSTDDHRPNCLEANISRILEANNQLLNAQLDTLNKNSKLEREQRKESNDALLATLGKLTEVLTKIAEKL